MARRSAASVEMRTPAIASAMVHVFVLTAAVLNLDFFSRPPQLEPEPVMVEFEAIDKKAAAPTVGNPPPQPKDVPIAQETTKAPPPKSADPPPAPPQPKPEVVEAKPKRQFERAAIQAINKWRYQPRPGATDKLVQVITLKFKLES